jgi:glycerol-3-phosphate acyltransferase PlsY
VVLAALAGSIPFGLLVARARGVDIRQAGSGNIGATNVTRSLGLRAGALVLLLDAGKGALPVALGMRAGASPHELALVGGVAILGHCFSPWLRFRGGKGVATALGVFGVLAPLPTALGALVFVAVLALTRVPALGSLAGMVAVACALVATQQLPYAAFAGLVLALLIFTHRRNLAGLRTKPP